MKKKAKLKKLKKKEKKKKEKLKNKEEKKKAAAVAAEGLQSCSPAAERRPSYLEVWQSDEGAVELGPGGIFTLYWGLKGHNMEGDT